MEMTRKQEKAYCAGVIAKINGLTEKDNPYKGEKYCDLWLKGFNEQGSIKRYKLNI